MKCGIGKCGRCNIGDKYVCKDGPVFLAEEVELLSSEEQRERIGSGCMCGNVKKEGQS